MKFVKIRDWAPKAPISPILPTSVLPLIPLIPVTPTQIPITPTKTKPSRRLSINTATASQYTISAPASTCNPTPTPGFLSPTDWKACATCSELQVKHFLANENNTADRTCPDELLCRENLYPLILHTMLGEAESKDPNYGKYAAAMIRRRLSPLAGSLDVHQYLTPTTTKSRNAKGEIETETRNKLSLMIDFTSLPVDLSSEESDGIQRAVAGAFPFGMVWEVYNGGVEAQMGAVYETNKEEEREGREMDEEERIERIGYHEHAIVAWYRARFFAGL